MAAALVDIANNAGGKIGGFGDQLTGEGFVTAAQLTADADKVSQWINDKYPVIRQKIYKDFAAMKAPFIEGEKFASLGPDLKQYDLAIASIAVSSTVVTITTQEAHGRSTGDTVFLAEIKQDEDEDADVEQSLIVSLNGTTETIIVTTTTAFTIATVGVDLTWIHQANTGIVSYVPEIGQFIYAFKLPSDYFAMVRQTDEFPLGKPNIRDRKSGYRDYRHKPILNRDGDGFILLTNFLTNCAGNSAYIQYVIDQTDFTLFSPALEECIAMLLAAELCPIVGRDLKTRQAILVEYLKRTVPEAKMFNHGQSDNETRYVPDFSGGRSGSGVIPIRGSSLGTYKAADGSRRSI